MAMALGLLAGTFAACGTVAAQPDNASGVERQIELTLWQSIDSNNDPALYEAYLVRYPNGVFADVARLKITKLRGAVPAPTAVPVPATTTAPAPVAVVPPPVQAPAPVAVPVNPVPVTPPPLPPAPPPVQVPEVPPAAASVPPPVAAVAPPAADSSTVAPSGADQLQELNRTLQDLSNSQISLPVQPSPGASAAAASASPPDAAPPPPSAPVVAAQVVAPTTGPLVRVINGVAIPSPPVLAFVTPISLPTRFCSDVARNTFHSTQYAPVIAVARRNNQAAITYMAKLNAMYEQYHLSDNAAAQNALVEASRTYEPQAQAAFDTLDGLVHLYPAIMAVPIVACDKGQ
ncbi:hypothetical protein [Novosphingobium sp. FKTRR1]|uniref:hypothetical protein n=1 Tax=Novosphingobium sp. FKTRR1 TaxID=2879118 RepID=UPI001CF07317|nr:hypothetical protein [Novosphingobium sp. FKTRR1]